MKLTDFNNLTNFGIEDPRMTTIGGVAFRHLDRLPRVGDSIAVEGIIITVLEMDEHRIARVRVSRGTRDEEAVPGGMTSAEAMERRAGAGGDATAAGEGGDALQEAGAGVHVDDSTGGHGWTADMTADREAAEPVDRPPDRPGRGRGLPGNTTDEKTRDTGNGDMDRPHKLAR
jgi:hypothetical protein